MSAARRHHEKRVYSRFCMDEFFDNENFRGTQRAMVALRMTNFDLAELRWAFEGTA